jgi:hypothetical protein
VPQRPPQHHVFLLRQPGAGDLLIAAAERDQTIDQAAAAIAQRDRDFAAAGLGWRAHHEPHAHKPRDNP